MHHLVKNVDSRTLFSPIRTPLELNPDMANLLTARPKGQPAFSDGEIKEWFANTNISLIERKRIYTMIENFVEDVDATTNDQKSSISRTRQSSSEQKGADMSIKTTAECPSVVDVDALMAEFVVACTQFRASRARIISREYATLEAFHITATRPDSEDEKLDEVWSMFPFGSILVYACVRWLEEVGGYQTVASIQKPHRPHLVREILHCFTGFGDGDVQIKSLHDITELEPSDVMHAIREYLMFVRNDSIIPQCLVKHFIDKKKNVDSLRKLMTTGYMTFECRATLLAFLRHAFNYYNLARWPEDKNKSTLEYFAQSMTWVTADNKKTKKQYILFIRSFSILLRSLIMSAIKTE